MQARGPMVALRLAGLVLAVLLCALFWLWAVRALADLLGAWTGATQP